jgi:hypothetical protein
MDTRDFANTYPGPAGAVRRIEVAVLPGRVQAPGGLLVVRAVDGTVWCARSPVACWTAGTP